MVLILDGNSEIGTHTHSETVKLIYLRHLNRITAIESYLKKNICFASNVSNVFWFTISYNCHGSTTHLFEDGVRPVLEPLLDVGQFSDPVPTKQMDIFERYLQKNKCVNIFNDLLIKKMFFGTLFCVSFSQRGTKE